VETHVSPLGIGSDGAPRTAVVEAVISGRTANSHSSTPTTALRNPLFDSCWSC
jgi:hypothetical protein